MPPPRAQVSSAHLKLDARLVRSAPLASMSLHLDAQNDKFMLKRAQKKITRQGKSRRNEKKNDKKRSKRKHTKRTRTQHEHTNQKTHVLLNANLAFASPLALLGGLSPPTDVIP